MFIFAVAGLSFFSCGETKEKDNDVVGNTTNDTINYPADPGNANEMDAGPATDTVTATGKPMH